MAKLSTPKGKIVRRFGKNIFDQPKFNRLLQRKPNGPGKAPGKQKRGKISDYGLQLNEKQKLRFSYGLSERQFRNLFLKARKSRGDTADRLMELLESRFDNIVYRMGWASTRAQARQLITHKHLLVNGSCLNIPSAVLSEGDTISIKNRSNIIEIVQKNISSASPENISWIKTDKEHLTGTIVTGPWKDANEPAGKTQLVIEYYSRR